MELRVQYSISTCSTDLSLLEDYRIPVGLKERNGYNKCMQNILIKFD